MGFLECYVVWTEVAEVFRVEKQPVSLIPHLAWLWHNIALGWGNIVPLPGVTFYVVRKIWRQALPHRIPADKTLLSLLLFTLHILDVSCWYTTGIGCEESGLTLHHSSPLFTWLSLWAQNYFETMFSHLLWPALAIYCDQLLSSMVAGPRDKVKSGEEWWRVKPDSSRT